MTVGNADAVHGSAQMIAPGTHDLQFLRALRKEGVEPAPQHGELFDYVRTIFCKWHMNSLQHKPSIRVKKT
ncbi:hypothetical protein F183_A27900 [Bryobacterales bacterium F-183]|nr:hypothetical protein F183_A27900 [Bryobacterales bacterium F-183]